MLDEGRRATRAASRDRSVRGYRRSGQPGGILLRRLDQCRDGWAASPTIPKNGRGSILAETGRPSPGGPCPRCGSPFSFRLATSTCLGKLILIAGVGLAALLLLLRPFPQDDCRVRRSSSALMSGEIARSGKMNQLYDGSTGTDVELLISEADQGQRPGRPRPSRPIRSRTPQRTPRAPEVFRPDRGRREGGPTASFGGRPQPGLGRARLGLAGRLAAQGVDKATNVVVNDFPPGSAECLPAWPSSGSTTRLPRRPAGRRSGWRPIAGPTELRPGSIEVSAAGRPRSRGTDDPAQEAMPPGARRVAGGSLGLDPDEDLNSSTPPAGSRNSTSPDVPTPKPIR